MSQRYTARIQPSYVELRSIYLGASAVKDPHFSPGRVSVRLPLQGDFAAEGTLNRTGFLSGMAKLYHALNLKPDDTIEFELSDSGDVVVLAPPPPSAVSLPATAHAGDLSTVFARRKLKYIHLEPFRPSSLDEWEPEGETDIYLAFGVLQEFTDYQYCCAASKALLTRLGAQYDETSKPDAVLIHRTTGEYLMAEWKKYSVDFKSNHRADDVDVLICWHDNETDRSKLPASVLALHAVAKTAAQQQLLEG